VSTPVARQVCDCFPRSRLGADKRRRGVGVKARPKVDPRSGLGLDADSERRRIVTPGNGQGCEVVGWPCSPTSAVDGVADPEVRSPVIPSLPAGAVCME
jgi:hypothetical protein